MELESEKCRQVKWADMKKDENCASMGSSSSLSDSSLSSLLIADDDDDATTSSSTSSASSPSLFEFADLMSQLPIKRGLSKYYDGKSESFACLRTAESVEDLAKKERMKACKSYGSNLNRRSLSPKATIAKRSSPKGALTFTPKPTNTTAVN